MKKTKLVLLPALLAMLSIGLGACSSESEYTSNVDTHDCAITKITLGTLKRTLQITPDSSYTVTVNGAYYPLYIDQVNNRIYNADSLPTGTDVAHVTFAALTSSGVTTIKSLSSKQDTLFATTDSTDFTTPRELTVNAYDGLAKKRYEVKINVHREEADSFVWKNVLSNNSQLKALQGEHRAFGRADSTLLVFGQTTDGPVAMTIDRENRIQTTTLPEGFNAGSVIADLSQTNFYALTANGLYHSANGLTWEAISTTNTPDALLAAGTNGLYGMKNGAFCSSTDGGHSWQADEADETAKLPVKNMAGTVNVSRTDGKMESIIVVGQYEHTADNGDKAYKPIVWVRDIDLTGVNTFGWYCLPEITGQTQANLPAISAPTLFTYDNALWLLGKTNNNTLAPIYISQDNGRTWDLPGKHVRNPLQTLLGQAANISGATTANGFIWLLENTTGSLWRGRYNRLGWKNEQTKFEKSARQNLNNAFGE